jgi:SSS family solute:Na+ symporter
MSILWKRSGCLYFLMSLFVFLVRQFVRKLQGTTWGVSIALLLKLSTLAVAADQLQPGVWEFSESRAAPADWGTLIEERPGAAVAFMNAHTLILAGGLEDKAPTGVVARFAASEGGLIETVLPDLPFPLTDAAAVASNGLLYVAGGRTDSGPNLALIQLDLAKLAQGWKVVSEIPVSDTFNNPILVLLHGKLYLAGAGKKGTEIWSYNPKRSEWRALSSSPESIGGFVGAACGDAHLLFFQDIAGLPRIWAYHLVTDRWVDAGTLPQMARPVGAFSNGTSFAVLTPNEIVSARAILTPTKYGIIDHLVVATLAATLIGVGVYFSRREKSSSDFFRAGKRIPWWAAGLSLFANGASAISLMAMPGKAYAENWIYFSGVFYIVIIQLPLILLVYVPLARRLKIATANEYLERRYNLPIRLLGSLIFSMNQMLGRVAATLLLPAIAVSAIFGLPMEYSILIMGVVATLYVTLGGLEAVVWTDVLQAAVMLMAVLLCAVWVLSAMDLAPQAALQSIRELDKLQMFDTSFDWTAPIVLILLSNTLALALGMIGDQNFIQRVQCTHDERDARKAVITQLAVAIPMNAMLFTLGTLLFLFYSQHTYELSPALKADGIFPFFAAQHLPVGMAGVVVCALLAATMSTVSGAVNSVANIGMEDVYRRFFKSATDHSCLMVGKWLTFGLGVFGTVAALVLARSNLQSVWDLALMITGMILAPITGIFVLGIFTRRANAFGVSIGVLASVGVNFYAQFYLNLHSMGYLALGVLTCIVVGYLASFLAPRPPGVKVHGLTIYTLRKTENEA